MFQYQVPSGTTNRNYMTAARAYVKARGIQVLLLLSTGVLLYGITALWPATSFLCLVIMVYLLYGEGPPRCVLWVQRFWPVRPVDTRLRIVHQNSTCTISSFREGTASNCLVVALRSERQTNMGDSIVVFHRDSESLADLKEFENVLRSWRTTGTLKP